MTKTNLAAKAVKIKGKDYVLVSDRILAFNQEYPKGSITTALVSAPESQTFIIKATVIPDVDTPQRQFTGYSQATIGQGMVNQTSALENAETSAVGRALGMMGIGVLDSIASADEMRKAGVSNSYAKATTYISPTSQTTSSGNIQPDIAQKQLLTQPCKNCGGRQAWSYKKGMVYCPTCVRAYYAAQKTTAVSS